MSLSIARFAPPLSAVRPASAGEVRVAVPLEPVMLWLTRIAAFLVAAFVVTQYVSLGLGQIFVFGLVPLFDLAGDGNLPRFFQALVLIACGLAFLGIGADRTDAGRLARRWVFLGLLFLCLGLDEAAQLQSRASLLVSEAVGASAVGEMAMSGLGGAVIAVWLAPLLTVLPRPALQAACMAAAAAVGALVLDSVGEAAGGAWGYTSFGYALTIAAGKGLEMATAILALRVALEHLKRRRTTLRLFAA